MHAQGITAEADIDLFADAFIQDPSTLLGVDIDRSLGIVSSIFSEPKGGESASISVPHSHTITGDEELLLGDVVPGAGEEGVVGFLNVQVGETTVAPGLTTCLADRPNLVWPVLPHANVETGSTDIEFIGAPRMTTCEADFPEIISWPILPRVVTCSP